MKKLKQILSNLLLLIILIITNFNSSFENIYMLSDSSFPNDNNPTGNIISLIIIFISTCVILCYKANDIATNKKYDNIQKLYPREEPYTKDELDNLLGCINPANKDHSKRIPVDLTLDLEIFEKMLFFFTSFFLISLLFYHLFYYYNILDFKNSLNNFILKTKRQHPRIFKYRFFITVFTYWGLLIIIHYFL